MARVQQKQVSVWAVLGPEPRQRGLGFGSHEPWIIGGVRPRVVECTCHPALRHQPTFGRVGQRLFSSAGRACPHGRVHSRVVVEIAVGSFCVNLELT